MSQANVEIAKRAVDAVNRRDVDAFMEFTTSEFELVLALAGAVEGGSFRGREGMEAYFEASKDTWGELRLIVQEIRDLGDRVLWLGQAVGLGSGSGVPVTAPLGAIQDFRDGKISRIRAYLDHGEALRAAGLSSV
jgi:ketosteroid isomerase-like protein